MNNPKEVTYSRVILALTGAGVLFSGYLSGVKLFTGTCALNEPCPYFLGYPACWYGFAMFVTMFVLILRSIVKNYLSQKTVFGVLCISLAGFLFAGSFIFNDISVWLASGSKYSLVLPSCVYGLIFYTAIFLYSLQTYLKGRSSANSLG